MRPKRVYVIRPDDGLPVVFLPHPTAKSAWVRTDGSVLVVACSLCEAGIGEACRDHRGPRGHTHWPRRAAARGKMGTLEAAASIMFASKEEIPTT